LAQFLGFEVMIDIEFSKRGRARVWIDELPPIEPISSDVSWRKEGFGSAGQQAFHKRVVVELFQPFGAAFHYGLLGAELQVNTSGELVVAVPIDMPGSKIPYVGSLAGKIDEVVIGSTPEFGEAVLAGLHYFPVDSLPSGHLNFMFIAHSGVGSARIVFEKLAMAVVRLLIRADFPQGEDEMTEVLRGA
jgi:hypothetical protein